MAKGHSPIYRTVADKSGTLNNKFAIKWSIKFRHISNTTLWNIVSIWLYKYVKRSVATRLSYTCYTITTPTLEPASDLSHDPSVDRPAIVISESVLSRDSKLRQSIEDLIGCMWRRRRRHNRRHISTSHAAAIHDADTAACKPRGWILTPRLAAAVACSVHLIKHALRSITLFILDCSYVLNTIDLSDLVIMRGKLVEAARAD